MQLTEPTTRRWTREEYYRMADLGFFAGQRVELMRGEVVEMAPQRNAHALALTLTDYALRPAFGNTCFFRVQLPLRMPQGSEPEPDLAVIPGVPRDYADHPTTALLIVEVADTTLEYDRVQKGSLYASAGIQDYWILNLVDRQLEIFRGPVADGIQPFGFRFAQRTLLTAGERASPLAAAHSRIPVADLLP